MRGLEAKEERLHCYVRQRPQLAVLLRVAPPLRVKTEQFGLKTENFACSFIKTNFQSLVFLFL